MHPVLLIQVSQTTAEDLCAGAVPDAVGEVVSPGEAEPRCRQPPQPVVAVLGPWLPEPVGLAQRLRGADEDLALLLLAEPTRLPALQRAVRFAPFLGGDVRCLPADDLEELCDQLADALQATLRRRRHRSQMTALRGASPAVPAERSGQRYFGRLLGEAPVGIVAVDPRGAVVGTNRRAGELLGAAESELLGEPIASRFAATEAAIWRRLLAPRRLDEPARGELLELPDGEGPRYLEASASPYPVVAGEAGVLVFLTDVTDRVLAERERQRLVESLAETARFREQFLGILGHDLRTPLQVVTLAAHLLQATELDPRQRSYVERIASSGDRMRAMVQDLLDFTRARLGGGLPLSPRDADLGLLARQVCEEQEAAHPDRRVTVEVTGDAHGWWDPDRLYQLLSNLVGNALRYSPPETPARIAVRGEEGETVALTVHNQGEPIPPERLESIFDPFRRATRRNPSEGLGLGLFIVHQIVRAHGGTLEVTSTVEHGTTFEARLPRRAPEEPQEKGPPGGA
ncbi:MAG TPA: ATP-binding protein [Thermoanaerobaculia bacterium]|nr:ATP-binding protein [Thermoanaerobaculia bacterium]